jgi:hypothetical protein
VEFLFGRNFAAGGIFVWEEFCRGWNFCLGGILFAAVLWQAFYFAAPRIFFGRLAIKGEKTSPFAAAYPFCLLVCVRVPLLILFACSFVFVCRYILPLPPVYLPPFAFYSPAFFVRKNAEKRVNFLAFAQLFPPRIKKSLFG